MKQTRKILRHLVQQIGWSSTNTWSDVSYDVLDISRVLNHPKVENITMQARSCEL